MAKGVLVVVFAFAACGRGSKLPSEKRDAATRPVVQDSLPQVEVSAVPLGMPDVASFGWRKRAGQSYFATARKAEGRDDWAAVVIACKQALAADPIHLEAAWLLAVGLAKTGQLEAVLPPLQLAVAGDFDKWGQASLDQPALQPWLATDLGRAWRRRIEADRKDLATRIAGSLIVIAHGDLYAFDGKRWFRLTHTSGAVVAGLAGPHELAYVTRGKSLGVGIVDFERVWASHPQVQLPPVIVTITGNDVWIGKPWQRLDLDGTLHPSKAQPATAATLIVSAHSAALHEVPTDVKAGWDTDMLASAMRIVTSNRVVSVPSPGLIDGNSIRWSADRAHLAFIAIDDHCVPGTASAAAYLADSATGTIQELERAKAGFAVQWVSHRELALAGDRGVSLVTLGGQVTPVEGATALPTPRRKPRCTPEPAIEEPVDDDPGEASGVDAVPSH